MSREDFDRRSYREADLGESYETNPRVISSHKRSTYSRLLHLSDNLNFNSPIFAGMLKRNRSIGSAQAFIVELALADKRFVEENLLPFCLGDGINVLLTTDYMDQIYYERLDAYTNRLRQKRKVQAPSAPAPQRRNQVGYMGGNRNGSN